MDKRWQSWDLDRSIVKTGQLGYYSFGKSFCFIALLYWNCPSVDILKTCPKNHSLRVLDFEIFQLNVGSFRLALSSTSVDVDMRSQWQYSFRFTGVKVYVRRSHSRSSSLPSEPMSIFIEFFHFRPVLTEVSGISRGIAV